MPPRLTEETKQEMQEGLRIDASSSEDLDHELITQAQSYGHVGSLFALAVAVRDAKKHDLEILEATLDHEIREQFTIEGERITEDKVKAAVKLEQRHQRAYREYLSARFEADSWEALKDAYKQRSYMLREITNLRATDYFGEAVGAGARREAGQRSFKRRLGDDEYRNSARR